MPKALADALWINQTDDPARLAMPEPSARPSRVLAFGSSVTSTQAPCGVSRPAQAAQVEWIAPVKCSLARARLPRSDRGTRATLGSPHQSGHN